ncbi:MAG: allantoate amidohydrolase [Hyphomicrobiales bacterium]|nr:allantoate amidohydrolase [Hyphomicrobiales bacterium]
MKQPPMIDGHGLCVQLDALARISSQADGLTRLVMSAEHRKANDLVATWMRAAGMRVHEDAIGNIIGRYEGLQPEAPALIVGSHLDSVRHAGRYDGPLGVLAAIAGVAALHQRGEKLAHAIEVIGFCDEEGTRFGATMLGSRAVAGSFDDAALALRDDEGISLAEAMQRFGLDPEALASAARRPGDCLGYLELHIEQGPVLEALGLPCAAVTAINGATRLAVTLTGTAGHAGTVPMAGRHDALCAAAACVLAVEDAALAAGLVATVGRLELRNGAINVIPGEVHFTIDLRAPQDDLRHRTLASLEAQMRHLCERRGVGLKVSKLHELAATPCAPHMIAAIDRACTGLGLEPHHLASGAGHDGMAMAALCPIGMIFLRCKGGISHHPDESITPEDACLGASLLLEVMRAPGLTSVNAASHKF